ncbi:MAG: hypothetical protein A2842_02690 [Candidatus Wildermuthbacteria bacterium RIFCSPHIGHO2_01_FULL_48_25]|nr:MAG: hypothetical protein A2842_02690 [Candidatus Wildermuthbacteria bacterium RIFCSPHIGHO2_01_FULL_48_25]
MKTLLKKIIIPILQLEAKLILRKYKPRVVVVTGNVGKTSSKDAIYAVLKNFGYARKSYKSYNSEIGVPLTILGASSGWSDPVLWLRNLFHGLSVWLLPHEYPHWLALEVGADRPGDIEKISQWLFADVAVLTRLAKVPVHVEYFGSPEKVFEEKEQILKTLKDDGILVANFDDEEIMKIAGGYRGRVVTYGFSKGADICAGSFRIRTEKGRAFEKPIGVSFRLAYGDSSLPISIDGVVGIQHAYAALGAVAVGIALGFNPVKIIEALRDYEPQNGRMKLIEGIKDSIIIDDSYNASPVAVNEGLDAMASIPGNGRKIVVLGDMLELGKYSAAEHKQVGVKAASFCSMLITVGLRGRQIAEGALGGGLNEEKILQFDESREAGLYLQNIIKEGDIILVKGSQGLRMERAVEEIMAHPHKASELLVRQDKEWR